MPHRSRHLAKCEELDGQIRSERHGCRSLLILSEATWIIWQLDVRRFAELLLHEPSNRPASSPGHRGLDKAERETIHRRESSSAARQLLGPRGKGAHNPVVFFERGSMLCSSAEFSGHDVGANERDAGAQSAQRARARCTVAD